MIVAALLSVFFVLPDRVRMLGWRYICMFQRSVRRYYCMCLAFKRGSNHRRMLYVCIALPLRSSLFFFFLPAGRAVSPSDPLCASYCVYMAPAPI